MVPVSGSTISMPMTLPETRLVKDAEATLLGQMIFIQYCARRACRNRTRNFYVPITSS
jgi:hypothetical protein